MDNGATWTDLCATGMKQSPIDFAASVLTASTDRLATSEGWTDENDLPIALPAAPTGRNNYPSAAIKMDLQDDEGSLVGATYLLLENGDSADLYAPAQLHFHAPSEHTVAGEHFDAEMHIVHLAADGTFDGTDYTTATEMDGMTGVAVYGVFFAEKDCVTLFPEVEDDDGLEREECEKELKASNDFFEQMGVFGTDESLSFSETADDVALSVFMESIASGNFYSYSGSFTTPPCTEGVAWTVLKAAAPISPANLASLKARYAANDDFAPCAAEACSEGNNRVVMPVNDRDIYDNSGALQGFAVSALAIGLALAF